jgi:hypothetical protein
MKFLLLLFLTLFSAFFPEGNPTPNRYQFKNGVFTGEFVSYHDNGNKKAEGTFTSNQKTGLWKVWDAKGQLLMTREYTNSFDFKILEAYSSNGQPLAIPAYKKYELTPNADGYISYPEVTEENVLWMKRIWRMVEPSEMNSSIFDNQNMYYAIKRAIAEGKDFTVYSPESDNFSAKLPFEKLQEIYNSDVKIETYRLKEECIYNKELQMTETRILGICPVAAGGKDLFWIFFPDLRPFLAKNEIKISSDSIPVRNLDDLFFFRQFNSMIYKESNTSDQEISDYSKAKEISSEAEKIELKMLEMEIDSWILPSEK